MNTHRKSSTVLTAVMILAVPCVSWSGQGDDDDHGWNKGGNKRNEHYNIHYKNSYYGHYSGKGPNYSHNYPHYYPQYNRYSPCNNCGNHHHNNHNHDNDKLWIGLLGGGILGYGLGAYQHSNSADQGNNPQAISAPPPPAPFQYATTAPINPCLQEREYRTRIMVGGKEVEGYGTACLQPDGSWRYGAAQPESY